MDDRYNESSLKQIFNHILVGLLKGVSLLPFPVIYALSDFFAFLIIHIFKYRKKVILTNLKNSFPEKTEKEIGQIANRFYRHFCDLMLETVKAYSMSEKEFNRRMVNNNKNLWQKEYNEGRSVILLGTHYNNWEWNSRFVSTVSHKLIVVYNPIRGNNALEKFLLKSRGRWGGTFIPVHKSARATAGFSQMGYPTILYLIADQTPPPTTKSWIIFMNQETPFFSGPEKIAAKSNQPVYLQHIKKVKRGHYEVFFYKLVDNPAEVDSKEVLKRYAAKMEEIIRDEPEYYLWSHRRWKHKRPDEIPLYD